MSYVNISAADLKNIAAKIIDPHFAKDTFDMTKNRSFASLLTKLADENIEAARGLLIIGCNHRTKIPVEMALRAVRNHSPEYISDKQRLIDLMALYDYLPSFNPHSILHFSWTRDDLLNMTRQALSAAVFKIQYQFNLSSSIATLDVARAFTQKILEEQRSHLPLLDFIAVIDTKCLNEKPKNEIEIRLGLILYVSMSIYNTYTFGHPFSDDPFYKTCVEFLRIKDHRELNAENRANLLNAVNNFTPDTMRSLEYEVVSVKSEKKFQDCRRELSALHTASNPKSARPYYDPEYKYDSSLDAVRDRVADFATSIYGLFAHKEESGFKNLVGAEITEDSEFLKRWTDALQRLPDNILSEKTKLAFYKILHADEPDLLVDVNKDDEVRFRFH